MYVPSWSLYMNNSTYIPGVLQCILKHEIFLQLLVDNYHLVPYHGHYSRTGLRTVRELQRRRQH